MCMRVIQYEYVDLGSNKEIYRLCLRKSKGNRDIQREIEREGEGEREIERAWPTMRSKEWGRLGWTDLDRQSA